MHCIIVTAALGSYCLMSTIVLPCNWFQLAAQPQPSSLQHEHDIKGPHCLLCISMQLPTYSCQQTETGTLLASDMLN